MKTCRLWLLCLPVLVLAAGFVAPVAVAADGNPEITVMPESVQPGDVITVAGEGYDAGADITVSLTTTAGSRELGMTTADDKGHFRFEDAVPDDAPAGAIEVRADSGEASAIARITLRGVAPGEVGSLAATTMEFSAEQEEDGHILLTATVTDALGQPIAEAPVHFALKTTLLDVSGEVTLAEATTDADGVATAEYEPTFGGAMEAVARFEGVGFYEESEAPASFEVTQFEPAYVSQESPLGVLRDWAPIALALVVLGVWSTFGFVIYQVFRVVRAGGEA